MDLVKFRGKGLRTPKRPLLALGLFMFKLSANDCDDKGRYQFKRIAEITHVADLRSKDEYSKG